LVLLSLWLFCCSAQNASAYTGVTTLAYSTSSGQLSGYTGTSKEWWDADSGYDCVYWEYDPEFGEYCASWVYWENWVSVIGRLYTPSGGTYANGYAKGFSYAVLDLIPFTPSETGIWNHVGNHYVEQDTWRDDGYGWYFTGTNVNYFGSTTQQANVTCTVPTGETTESGGWYTENTTLHLWNQTLTGGSFGGRTVTEQDPGGGGPDTCWFEGSIFNRFEAITGGTWPVGGDNRWGPDAVGWNYNAVQYYRNQGRAPCDTRFPQRMVITCPGSADVPYVTNLLRAGMTETTVWSERAGQYAERVWP
jgi:hypothetical protein